jgi:hypothetical protein
MFHYLHVSTQRIYANRESLPVAAIIAIFSLILLSSACSGGPTMGKNTSVGTGLPGSASGTSGSGSATSSLIISTTLPAASVGAAYNATLSASGGKSPYTFSVASGQLPQGLDLGNSGTISGTPVASGNFNFSVSVSDSEGVTQTQSLQLTVANAATPNTVVPAGGNSFSHLQSSGGWSQFGQTGPNYVDCSPSPCDGISFSMTQNVSSPSMSGHASEFNVGGSAPFSDGLWNNHLIGPSSSQGLPDDNQSIVPGLHDFTYDVYFYGDNFGPSQALEFDINQFFSGMGFIWGHECRIASGSEWDVWDNQNGYWKHTGIACHPNPNAWNHLTLKVQRTTDNHLVYQSITLNGVSNNLNWTFGHGSAPGWYGLTINYQMDGDSRQDSYNVYLDDLTFSYQ